MNSVIEKLTELMRPPEAPVGAIGDWNLVQKQLGTSLSSDYKAVISIYGCGLICEFLTLLSPFVAKRGMNLIHKAMTFPFTRNPDVRRFPESHGLFLCSTSRNGDCFYWQTGGDPDQWNVVFNRNETDSFDRLDGINYSEFVLEFITGKNDLLKYATDAFCGDRPTFTPLRVD